MRILRALLTSLLLAVALAALLAAAAFVPFVQTWAAQLVLAGHPDLRASIGSLSAGFGKVEITDLHLEAGGGVLALPSLEARLPLATALRDRRFRVQSLVSKGWTLDLTGAPEAEASGSQGGAGQAGNPALAAEMTAQRLARVFHDALSAWKLPLGLSVDGVDLEGDVLVNARPGEGPARVHLTIKGGGMAAGRESVFAIEASGDFGIPGYPGKPAAARGRLFIGEGFAGSLDRVGINASISAAESNLRDSSSLTARISAARTARGETGALLLIRGDRTAVSAVADFSGTTRRIEGTWRLDIRDSDLAPFVQGHPLPFLSAKGGGRFDWDASLSRLHAAGRLRAIAAELGALAPPLDRMGSVTFDASFDLAETGRWIRVDSLEISLAGARPIALLRSMQPFSFDAFGGSLVVANPGSDWVDCSIRDLPLAWLSGLPGGFTFGGGGAAGGFFVRAADGVFTLRPKARASAAGVSVWRADRLLGRNLDLSLSLSGEFGPQGWRLQWAPLSVESGGTRLATIDGTASRQSGEDQQVEYAGKWAADLGAPAMKAAFPGLSWLSGRSASGDFSASVGSWIEVQAKLAAVGHDPGHLIDATVGADIDANGAVRFLVPVKFTFGSGSSDVSAEGSWAGGDAGGRIDASLSGDKVALEQLRLLAAPFAAAANLGVPPQPGAGARIPFWGAASGRIKIAFAHLSAKGLEFFDVDATVDFDRESVRLLGARGWMPNQSLAKAEGSIKFDAASDPPYVLKATAEATGIQAAPFFASSPADKEPAVEGRFSVQGTLTGEGVGPADLAGRTRVELNLASTDGIVRFLRTSVADSIPETPTTASDRLAKVGSAVGSLFGIKSHSDKADENRLARNTEAVLDLTEQIAEIGCDRIAITAVREPDGTIRLPAIALSSPEESLSGSGLISGAPDLPLAARPLSIDLRLGARGGMAGLLSDAGLLSPEKDSRGYRMLGQDIHLGGNLRRIDASQWHDLLVKAATRKPPK